MTKALVSAAVASLLAGSLSAQATGTAASGRNEIRVVSLSPSNTETVCAIGGCSDLVAVTSNDDDASLAGLARVGSFGSIDVERVAAVDPTLVLASPLDAARTAPALRALGIRVLIVPSTSVADVFSGIAMIGTAVGRTAEAARLAAVLENRIDAIQAAVGGLPTPTVYWELTADMWTAGPGSYVDELISDAGGVNIAHSANAPWAQLSAEQIIAGNPDVIFLADNGFGVSPRSLAARPGWSAISAVKSGRVFGIPNVDLLSRPGPEIGDALTYIAETLHPKAFGP